MSEQNKIELCDYCKNELVGGTVPPHIALATGHYRSSVTPSFPHKNPHTPSRPIGQIRKK